MGKKIIVTLGNPETRYEKTRHNAGWLWADAWRVKRGLPAWQQKDKFHGQITTDGDVIICRPTTYMNDSGLAAAALVNFYQIDSKNDFLLIYDDLDLTLGTYKLTTHPPRTHNGVASVQQHLGTKDFAQVRIGIDDRRGDRRIPAIDYVLGVFSEAQLQKLQQEVFPASREEVARWLSNP